MWVERIALSDKGEWGASEGSPTRVPDLVFLFGATDALRASTAPASLSARFPAALHLGCSSGTMVDGAALSDEGLTALAVGFERTRLKLATHQLGSAAESRAAGLAVGAQLAGPDLAGVFVLSEGLGVNGSALVEGLVEAVGSKAVLSGGLAGDGARFGDTLVTVGGEAASNLVAAIGFYGDSIRISHGSAGGWDEFGPHRRITRSEGNVLFELDGKPALDLYERYLGDEAADLPASGLLYPLKIWSPEHPGDEVVRTILAVDHEARSMTFAGDVPEGWNARLMRGAFDRLTEGAASAAQHARSAMESAGVSPELCLFVSCVGRRLLMGQRTEEEVEAVGRALGGNTPLIGFYSYGEIAPNNETGVCGLHNQTVTLTLFAEAA
jgi:hypothetical protein